MEIREERVGGTVWVVKRAATGDEEIELRHEAGQLRSAAHPGVVELGAWTDASPVELRTRSAGRPLPDVGGLTAAEICGLGAAVATVLADLHDLGVVHGPLRPDHVLIGPDGRPVLCGFGSSTSVEAGDPAGDVRDLAAILADRLGADAPRRLTAFVQRTAAGGRRVPPARALASRLADLVPDGCLPRIEPLSDTTSTGESTPLSEAVMDRHPLRLVAGPPHHRRSPHDGALRSDDTRPGRSGHRRRRRIAAGGAVLAVVAGAVGLFLEDRQTAGSPAACPGIDAGCGPLHLRQGQLVTTAGRFVIDLPDPVVVLGRWGCNRTSLPAALDPRTGQVWAWPAWAPRTGGIRATPVTTTPGASSLRTVPGRTGCDRLMVIGPGARSAVVRPSGAVRA